MIWVCIALFIVTYFLLGRHIRSFKVGNYKDKHVFVTGCDSGFGRLLVLRLDSLQFNVFAGCLTQQGRESLENNCSNRVKTCLLDVTKEDSIREALTFVKEHLPQGKGLWGVVNNAGVIGTFLTSEMFNKQDFVDMLNVNLLGPIQVIKTFLPLVRKEKGRLVNMTSIMGRFPATVSPYSVSKNGLEAYLDVLRKEIYFQDVKVSMIQPGAFATNLMDNFEECLRKGFESVSEDVKDVYGHDYIDTMLSKAERSVFSKDLGLVVDAYVHALTARYPKIRYVVGWDAHFFFLPLSYVPDWLGDLIWIYLDEIYLKSGFSIFEVIGKATSIKGHRYKSSK